MRKWNMATLEAMMVDIPNCAKRVTQRAEFAGGPLINASYTFEDGAIVEVSGFWQRGASGIPLEATLPSSVDPTTNQRVKCEFGSIAGVRVVSCAEHDDVLRVTSWKSGNGVFSAAVYKPTAILGARAEEAVHMVCSAIVPATAG